MPKARIGPRSRAASPGGSRRSWRAAAGASSTRYESPDLNRGIRTRRVPRRPGARRSRPPPSRRPARTRRGHPPRKLGPRRPREPRRSSSRCSRTACRCSYSMDPFRPRATTGIRSSRSRSDMAHDPYPFGWVAAADKDGEPWLQPDAKGCPSVPDDCRRPRLDHTRRRRCTTRSPASAGTRSRSGASIGSSEVGCDATTRRGESIQCGSTPA